MSNNIHIREMLEGDAEIIASTFLRQGWDKPVTLYHQYFQESRAGKRTVLVASQAGDFAGYVTILWESDYPPFQVQNIPEIADFNVLLKYRRQGIGNALLQFAETLAAKRTHVLGIGVGLTADYGAAQILYVKRGYIPDGLGIFQHGRHLEQGDQAQIDHDLALYFTKRISTVKP